MSAVKGIVFDKDGTLFDFNATWVAWAESFLLKLAGNDRARARQIGSEIGFDLDQRRFDPHSVVIAGTPEEVEKALRPHFEGNGADVLDLLNAEASQAPQIEAVPLDPLLTELTLRGLRLGVATNDAIDPAIAHLGEAGVIRHFAFIAGYDSGYGAKPGPGQLHAFCEQTGLGPQEVVMVGDSLHDLHAGQAAGMRTVGVLTGLAEASVLSAYAEVVLPDVGQIPAWLDRL
ncbi:MAG: HAD family hydrolase [Pseudomonadota bacterium]